MYNLFDDVYSYYFYETNIFGDIVGICNENGQRIISFIYDAWGNFITQWTYNPDDSDIFLEAILYLYSGAAIFHLPRRILIEANTFQSIDTDARIHYNNKYQTT